MRNREAGAMVKKLSSKSNVKSKAPGREGPNASGWMLWYVELSMAGQGWMSARGRDTSHLLE